MPALTAEPNQKPIGFAEVGSLTGAFLERIRRTPDLVAYREFTGARWHDWTWKDVLQRVECLRAALAAAGLKAGDRIALALPNGTDWVAFDMAALSMGFVVVPLYLDDSPANTAYVLAHAGARLLAIDSVARWQALLPHWADLGDLEHIWIKEAVEGESGGIVRPGLVSLAHVLERAGPPPGWLPADPEALATIIYTSGTTGRPKGAMLTQRALLWNADAAVQLIPPRTDDLFLSCLPLAHAFERTVGYYLPMLGGSTVAYSRSIKLIAKDFVELKPTVFLGVPRLYERAVSVVRSQADANLLSRALLEATARLGWRQFECQQGRGAGLGGLQLSAWRFLDRWLAARVRGAFGGRVRVAVSGGAPLPFDVSRLLLACGVPLIEGYGLTEAGPVVATNSVDDNCPGSVGRPLKGVEVKTLATGELVVRSPSAMTAYWKDPGLTEDTVDREGWLHTGDIAEIKGGRVFIRGRLRELLVLSTGEKVLPAEIEARILRSGLFENALVVGSGRPFLVAVVVVSADGLQRLTGFGSQGPADPNAPQVREAALREISSQLNDAARHEQVRAVLLTQDAWSVANGRLTPTLKVRRTLLEKLYGDEIARLYERPVRAETLAGGKRP
jgi:long-chain acyl-CoA synthetase